MVAEKSVLITGAGRGLGLSLTRASLARGHRVFATCRNPGTAPHLQDLAASHEAGRLTILPMDVVRPDSVEAASRAVARATGALDTLLGNAGINLAPGFSVAASRGPLAALDPEAMATLFRVNTLGNLHVLKAFQPLLARSPAARVICISSDRASLTLGRQGSPAYAISKTALNMLVRMLAPELAEAGIGILAVHPGWMHTDMGGPTAKVDPEAAAAEILDLADAADCPTGAFLRTDGTPLPW